MKTNDEIRPTIPRKYESILDALKEFWGLPSHSQVIIRLIVLSKHLKMNVVWIIPDGVSPNNEQWETLTVQTSNFQSKNHDQLSPPSEQLTSELVRTTPTERTQPEDDGFDEIISQL